MTIAAPVQFLLNPTFRALGFPRRPLNPITINQTIAIPTVIAAHLDITSIYVIMLVKDIVIGKVITMKSDKIETPTTSSPSVSEISLPVWRTKEQQESLDWQHKCQDLKETLNELGLDLKETLSGRDD